MDEDLQNDEYFKDATFPTTEDIVEEAVQQHRAEIFKPDTSN